MKWFALVCLVALLGGIAAGLVTGDAQRAELRTLEQEYDRLWEQKERLIEETMYLAIERDRARAQAARDSAARDSLTARIGPVLERTPASKTVTIVIDGEPMVAPTVLIDEREARIQELASEKQAHAVTATALSAEQLAHDATKRLLENTQYQLELARRKPPLLERLKDGALEILILLGVGTALGLAGGFVLMS